MAAVVDRALADGAVEDRIVLALDVRRADDGVPLVDERDAIEKEIAGLKLMKPSMDGAQYDTQMEKLLTSLALKTKQIRDLQAKKAPKP